MKMSIKKSTTHQLRRLAMQPIPFLTLAAVLLAPLAALHAEEIKPAKPNIILLLADDLRWDCLGFAGDTVIKTPNIDRLASRGVVFRNSFATSPVCAVSRAATLTGQYARRNGVHDFTTQFPDLAATYPGVLRASGYYTGFIGKWGVDAANVDYMRTCARAFDYWAGDRDQTSYWHERTCNYVLNNGTSDRENYHCNCPAEVWKAQGTKRRGAHPLLKDPVHLETWVIPHKVRQFLDQRDPRKPFNLSISFKAPHGPINGYAPDFSQRFMDAMMPSRLNTTAAEAERQPEFLRQSLESERGWKMAHDQGPGSLFQSTVRDYYRLVEGLDRSVGEIMAELERRGLADNTVIIFTSDNGHFHGEHGFYGKWLPHEESLRVPLVICDPRIPPSSGGGSCSAMVINVDLGPTMLDLAGRSIPPGMQGCSLKPLLTKPQADFRNSFFFEHLYEHGPKPPLHIEPSEGLRTAEWKYVHYIKQSGPQAEELYHLASDPLEMINRIGDSTAAAVLEKLRADYNRLRTELGPHQTWTRKPGRRDTE